MVTTLGTLSVDLYARKLAEKLEVPKLYSDIYQRIAELFDVPFLSKVAVKAAWQDCCFIRTLNRVDDVVHLPNQHLGRYGLFLKRPYIITVHDLIRYFDLKGYGTYIHRPNLRDRLYLHLDYGGVKKAARIIAVSRSTKRDLTHHLGIPEERISVVYEGVDRKLFRPTPPLSTGYPYLLFVGSEHPRKNLVGLLTAFKKLKREARFKDLKVVKVGKPGGPEADFRGHTMKAIRSLKLEGEVVFAEYVAEEKLPAYYSGAECLLLTSFYEGFGLPPLEAMACGCPAVTSNTSSLPEITGNAAIHVNPRDVDGLADAIRRVLTDDSFREEMVARGFARARCFSWERTAQQTVEVYQQADPTAALGKISRKLEDAGGFKIPVQA